jgi:drug/metabolite transporter (DMT)-like permease
MTPAALHNPHFRLFSGAVLISFSPVFVRLADVSASASGFYRALFGAGALVTYIAVRRRWHWPRAAVRVALLSASAFFAADLWFWHRSVLLIGPGLSTLIANLQVFVMIGAGAMMFREKPRLIQLFAAVLAILGLWLVLGGDWSSSDPGFRLGVALGLLTAVSYAGYLLSMRHARRRATDTLPLVEVTTVSIIVACLLGASVMLEGESLAIPAADDLAWLLAYGVLAHAVGLILIASSLTEATAAEVGIALLLQPALSLLWDVLFFGRGFSLPEVVGILLTLAAIFLGSWRRLP